MKNTKFRLLIREYIRKIVKEEVDNKQWMDITAALIKAKMFLNKSTFRFVNTDTMDKNLTRKSLEDFLMAGVKQGAWEEKVAKDYLMAIEGTIEKPLK